MFVSSWCLAEISSRRAVESNTGLSVVQTRTVPEQLGFASVLASLSASSRKLNAPPSNAHSTENSSREQQTLYASITRLYTTAAAAPKSTKMDHGIIGDMSASAISVVVGSTTGISPFLTLFLVGLLERMDPEVLNMEHIWDGKLERLLAGDAGLTVLGAATVVEFVSMCIPVVDELVDGMMTFVIPVLSIVASHSTFGLFEDIDAEDLTDLGDLITMDDMPLGEIFDGIVNGTEVDTPDSIGDGVSENPVTAEDVNDLLGDLLDGATNGTTASNLLDTLLGGEAAASALDDDDDDVGERYRRYLQQRDQRKLQEEEEKRRKRGISRFYQFVLTLISIVMALSLHVFKMIIRLFGEGWATGCITVVEAFWTGMTIFVVIYIQPLSIVVAIALLAVGSFGVWRMAQRIQNRRRRRQEEGNGVITVPAAQAVVVDTGATKRGKYDKDDHHRGGMQEQRALEQQQEDAVLQVALEESKRMDPEGQNRPDTLEDGGEAALQVALEQSKWDQ